MRRILLTGLFAFTMSGCVSTSPSRPVDTAALAAEKDAAMRAQVKCGVANVAQADDGLSDAATVAFALAIRCGTEYNMTTEAVGNTLDNDAQRRMFRDRRASRDRRIEDFLPIVMQYRQSTKAAK
jgi:hypothetical protein